MSDIVDEKYWYVPILLYWAIVAVLIFLLTWYR